MCWTKQICCLSLELGCLCVGTIHCIASVFSIVAAVVLLVEDNRILHDGNLRMEHEHGHISMLGIDETIFHSIIIMILLFSCLGAIASILLTVGVRKNKAYLVLTYFVYGVIMSVVLFVGSLLELIHNYWMFAAPQLIVTSIYIYALIAVHMVYEMMSRGIQFGRQPHELLENSTNGSEADISSIS